MSFAFASRRPAALAVLMALSVVLAGCGGGLFKKSPTTLNITMSANAQLNPNVDDEPSPVVVRIYELKSAQSFNQAEFFQLYDDDTKTLGPDLVAKTEYEIAPGTTKKIKKTTPDETAYIAVLAGFRDIDSATWRASAAVTKNKENIVTVTLTSLAVSLSAGEKKALGVF
ncbi:type VI secretion system lipoprotein TssJ [Amorphus orientalis]|uniref:Type VI secretion system protein VasD n=1 Tax=Amorphus orientalis TaxID=649198 RepID=A0AAE3VLK1_9HYPH|nr:type VI secretion system lipoprotein TssJ [Amorphus orientalis]MDQ0314296.1 type VI secretion system protein VasD [Amorphus orientalis]